MGGCKTLMRRPAVRSWIGAGLIATALLAVVPAPARAAADPGVVAGVRTLLDDALAGISARSGASDRLFYSDGLWENGDSTCWRCNLGPGVASAVRSFDGGDPLARARAIETFDRAIRQHQRADGSFPDVDPGTSSPGVNTMFVAAQLGTAYAYLKPHLGDDGRRRFTDSLKAAAEYLMRGDVTWYSNGNINLGYTEVLLLTWKARLDRYRDAYSESLDFTLDPPKPRWAGRGLQLTQAPARADGSDGRGYLAEASSTGPWGYDPDYTQVQADVASRMYLHHPEARTLRLLNLLTNQLRERVDSGWRLDTSGGTRFPEAGRRVPLMTPALAVLAWKGGRRDLVDLVPSQFAAIRSHYPRSLTNGWWYGRLGSQPTVMHETAHDLAGGVAAPAPPPRRPSNGGKRPEALRLAVARQGGQQDAHSPRPHRADPVEAPQPRFPPARPEDVRAGSATHRLRVSRRAGSEAGGGRPGQPRRDGQGAAQGAQGTQATAPPWPAQDRRRRLPHDPRPGPDGARAARPRLKFLRREMRYGAGRQTPNRSRCRRGRTGDPSK